MNLEKFKEAGIGLGIVILQVIFFRHLLIFGMLPDMVLIFLLWYMFKRNRTAAILMAAVLGFAQDALLDQWGLNMFSKTLTVFLIYRWVPDESLGRFQMPQVLILIFVAALIHNIFFVGLSATVQTYTAELIFWRFWIGNAIYTTIAAGIIQLFRVEKK